MRYICLVGSSEDGLRLRQRLSSVPGRTRPSSGEAFAPCLIAVGRDCGFGWRRSSSSSNRRGSSSPSVVATGTLLDLLHMLCLGMGRAHSDIAFFTPTTDSSRWRLRRCWTGIWRWRRGEWSQLPKAGVVLAVGPVLYGGGRFIANTQHKQSVTSISSRSCRPWRWCAQVTASQRFLAPRPIDETAGGNGDCGIQLRPDSGDVSSSAGERLAAAPAGRRRLLTAMGLKFMQL